MKADCFDIGTIQAFLDGELAHEEISRVAGHIAQCDACAVMLAQAEDESAIVFPALEREFNTLVPTQRLWNKINDEIAIERNNQPFWHRAWAYLRIALVNPSIAVAASVLIVAGLVAVLWMNRAPVNNTVAGTNSVKSVVPPADSNPAFKTTADQTNIPVPQPTTRFERAAYRSDDRRTPAPAVSRTSANASSDGYMPGEESYVKTISSLSRSVEEQKDNVLRPSERIAYERDMAVVNDAIAKVRKEVKKNPKNESAKDVLYSSYQNKIDLLNSVSQKEELLVSMR